MGEDLWSDNLKNSNVIALSVIGSEVDTHSSLVRHIESRIHDLSPQSNITHCILNYKNYEFLHPICSFTDGGKKLTNAGYPTTQASNQNTSSSCPSGNPGPRIQALTECAAKIMIRDGFQIPVYIISGGKNELSEKRFRRISQQLRAAHFKHIGFVDQRNVSHITQHEANLKYWKFHANHKKGGQFESEKDKLHCIEALNATFGKGINYAIECCVKYGTNWMKDLEENTLLKNIVLGETIMNCSTSAPGSIPDILCSSRLKAEDNYFFLVEEDQFVASNALLQMVEVLLRAPVDPYVGLFYLCDSYCSNSEMYNAAYPPYMTASPYLNSIQRNEGKTAASLLISLKTWRTMYGLNNNWIPISKAIDHWWNYIIYKENFTAHHVYPPITCHGSQGLEANVERNPDWSRGDHCCETFYNLRTMHPYMKHISLTNYVTMN